MKHSSLFRTTCKFTSFETDSRKQTMALATAKGLKTTKELIKEFCNYTTTHGVGRLAETKTIFSRLIWIIFIIGAFAMFFYETQGLFELYLSRPVSTLVQVRHKTKVTFPAVTVCNQNPVKSEEIPHDYIHSISKAISKRLAREGSDQREQNAAIQAFLNKSIQDPSATGNDTLQDDPYTENELKITYLFEELMKSKLAVENDTKVYQMGHKFKDLVFDCTFRGDDCRDYSKYWLRISDYRHGNCYRFNGGVGDNSANQTILRTRSTGPKGGLQLNLFIESSQFVPQLSHTAGARIVIHDQSEMPFPEDEGINLLPGTSTSVGIRRELIHRVDPFNNGSCRKSDDSNHPYSREACMGRCLARAQIKKCGCADTQFSVQEKTICDMANHPEKEPCLEDLAELFEQGELDCAFKCPSPCSEVVFKTSMSMAKWPSEKYKKTLFSRVTKRKNHAGDDLYLSDDPESLHKDFLQVRVFFEKLNYQEIREKLSYQEVNLLADIGGQLGLWIGISVLTCCEYLELLLILARSIFQRFAAKNNRVGEMQ